MKKLLAVAFGLALVAGPASASNTGFKLNYDLVLAPTGFSGLNWVAPPYFYFPDGNVGNPTQTARDFCNDLNGMPGVNTPVLNVQKFSPMTDTFQVKPCQNALTVFNLEPGIAYAAVLNSLASSPTTVAMVGSHNDLYAPNKGGTLTTTVVAPAAGFSGLNPIATPYHVMADNAEELCTMVNGGMASASDPVLNIQRFDSTADTFRVKPCSNALTVFNVVPGEGYFFVTGTPGDKQIAFDVY